MVARRPAPGGGDGTRPCKGRRADDTKKGGDATPPACAEAAALLAAKAESTLEPLNLTGGVHDPLLARIERVAVGADFDADHRLGGTRRERVPADALDLRVVVVVRMDLGLHWTSSGWKCTSGYGVEWHDAYTWRGAVAMN